MITKHLKRIIENALGCKIYRGWYPRGANLEFDRRRLLPNVAPLIVDVGANVGHTTLELVSQYPDSKIHACEPISGTFERLLKNVKHHSRVVCHQIALGDRTEESEMHLYEGTVNNSLKVALGEKSFGIERVNVQRLDNFCDQHNIQVVDYLKIDTEGYDLDVVRGGDSIFAENRVRVVVAELGFSAGNLKHVPFAKFLSAMHQRQMSLFGIYDQRREFDGNLVLRRADCMFVSNQHSFPGLAGSPDV